MFFRRRVRRKNTTARRKRRQNRGYSADATTAARIWGVLNSL